MNATAPVMINALDAMDPVKNTVSHAVEGDMKCVLTATVMEQKDVIHVLGMDMIYMGTNVPGVGAEDIRNAFHAMVMEGKHVLAVVGEVIRIALGVGGEVIKIVTIVMVKA